MTGKEILDMKDKFYWGNSVSSMQTEGGWNEGGKSLSVYDIRKAGEEDRAAGAVGRRTGKHDRQTVIIPRKFVKFS